MKNNIGFQNRGGMDIPDWAGVLLSHYWRIRVEGRDKVKRRRYYRYVAKEKLRLAELGIDQALIKSVCRYLVNLRVVSGTKMGNLMVDEPRQLILDFSDQKNLSVNFT